MMLTYAIMLALVVACALGLVIERRGARDAVAHARQALDRAKRRSQAHAAVLRDIREAAEQPHRLPTADSDAPGPDSSYSSTPSIS